MLSMTDDGRESYYMNGPSNELKVSFKELLSFDTALASNKHIEFVVSNIPMIPLGCN